MTASAAAQAPHRLVIVVARPGDLRAAQQHAILQAAAAALHERDVIVQNLTPEDAQRNHPEWHLRPPATFTVLLIGKDGGIKLRRNTPVPATDLTALIDTMPMRRDEMRR